MLKRGDKALVKYKKNRGYCDEKEVMDLCEIIAVTGRLFNRAYIVWNYEQEKRFVTTKDELYKLRDADVKKMLELQTAKKKGS